MLCDCYLATLIFFMNQFYSNHEILIKIVTRPDCYIMLARFCQLQEAAIEQMLEPFTSQYCYCKNLRLWEIWDWNFCMATAGNLV